MGRMSGKVVLITRTLWNSFKLLAQDYTADEKNDMFAGTATRVYRV